MTHSNVVRIDKGLEEEANRLEINGCRIGGYVYCVVDDFDRHGGGLPITRLQELFDEILEGACEALYGVGDPDAYNVVYHAARFHNRPGTQVSRKELDDAIESFAAISEEDYEAELADQR